MVGLVVCISAAAQVTTSSIEGVITDTSGEKIPNATVIAKHLPSGSSYGAVATAEGRYVIQGMRPGGPYQVTVSFLGFRPDTIDNVTLKLGEMLQMDFSLETETIEAIELRVSGKERFDSSKTGAATNFSLDDIRQVPTIDRNIYDIARLSPQASVVKSGGISLGGTNNRYNAFQIDGVASHDAMGLSSTGTNGGQVANNPIPLEAIAEVQVVVAPFDVRQNGFTGGGINAVTKSGTNTFQGTAYSYYNNQEFYGKTSGNHSQAVSKQSSRVLGASIGGAIVKDKFFYYILAESEKETYPSSYYPGYAGAAITERDVQQVSERYKAFTGYDGGGYGQKSIDTRTTSLLARIDWNINQKNKLSLRYSLLDASKDNYSSDYANYYFNGAYYVQTNRTHSIAAELHSQLGDHLHNELRVGYTSAADARQSEETLPFVTVKNMGTNNNTSVNIGTNPYTMADGRTQLFSLTDNLSFYRNNHTFTIGTHNEFFVIDNRFIANATGSYIYNSMEDFLIDRASTYSYTYSDASITGTATWKPTFTAGQFGLYAQDRWQVTPRLTLTYGIRADIPAIFYKPSENETFNSSHFAQDSGSRTGDVPKSAVLWSPRVGFHWYTDDSHTTLLRGGAGIFTGRSPFVWISNTFINNGVEMKGQTLHSGVPAFSTTPYIAPGTASNPSIDIISKDYRYPQVLRLNLAWEQALPVAPGWHFTLEALYTKTLNNVAYTNLAASDEGKRLYMVSSLDANENNTATYYTADTHDYSSVYYIHNTSKGYTYSLSASLNKIFRFGLDVSASYTFSHARAVNDAPKTLASDNWGKTYAVNSNSPELSWSLYDVPHRVVFAATYTKRYASRFATSVSLVSIASSGSRYSLTYNESKDLNGDAVKGNTLMYIPTSEELQRMTFADIVSGSTSVDAATQKAQMEAWIEGDSYLSSHRGHFAERNSMQTPFENHIDLKLVQEYTYNKNNDGKIQLSFDIINFGNMLNRSWGTYYAAPRYWKLMPVTVTSVTTDSDGNATPVYQYKGSALSKDDINSRWHAQIGLRITF